MKLKLDENIGRRGLELLQSAGHDVLTVVDQGLGGSPDERLFEICAAEERALVTLDHDFGQVQRFPLDKSAGVVILELGRRASVQSILNVSAISLPSCRPIRSLERCGSWSLGAYECICRRLPKLYPTSGTKGGLS